MDIDIKQGVPGHWSCVAFHLARHPGNKVKVSL